MQFMYYSGSYVNFTLKNTDWKKATGKDGKLAKHETSSAHRAAADMYKSRLNETSSSVAVHLSKAYAEKLQRDQEDKTRNREVLATIADIIRFLARQNISFRGHREGEGSDNRGNFLELVSFMANYNPLLKDWLENRPGNVSWLGHDVQNELLHLIADEVVSCIASECRGRPYSIMCDEVSDRANKELLSLVIRYVLDSGLVKEAVVGLIEVPNTAANTLCDIVIGKLNALGLPLELMVGQCFDGASNMSGQYNGLQARIKELCARDPLFVHCWAHVLNLVLQDAVKSVPLCSRIFELLQKIYVVIEGSPKRHAQYYACVSSQHLDDGLQALQSLSATRWAARCVNLRIVHRCLPAIIEFLEAQSDVDSLGLLKALKDFKFVFGLEFLLRIFMAASAASEALQAKDMDLAAAASAVETLREYITRVRTDANFNCVYDSAAQMAATLGISILAAGNKRKKSRPTTLQGFVMDSFVTNSHDALTASSEEEGLKNELRVDFFFPVLDRVATSLASRFNSECVTVMKLISSFVQFGDNFEDCTKQLASLARIDVNLCVAESNMIMLHKDSYTLADSAPSLQSVACKMVELKHSVVYKHFYALVVFLLTLPVTSASCERAHSKVDLVRSAVRASMGSDRLADLVLISSEKPTLDALQMSSVVNRFALTERALPL